MSNLEIREFSQAIINFTNGSPIPVEVKRLVLSDILHQLESATNAVLQSEIADRDRLAKEDSAEHGIGHEQLADHEGSNANEK